MQLNEKVGDGTLEEMLLISWLDKMFSRELSINKCVSLKVQGTLPMVNLSSIV